MFFIVFLVKMKQLVVAVGSVDVYNLIVVRTMIKEQQIKMLKNKKEGGSMGRHYTPIDYEANNPTWKARQFEIHGNKCEVCGSAENVEIHHIIPKSAGGDNQDSNIIVLCRKCHAKAHGKNQKRFDYKTGRHKLERPKNLEDVLDRYLDRIINYKDALKELGVKKNVFYRLLDEYREETGDARTHRDAFLGNEHGLTRQEYMRAYTKKRKDGTK